MSGSKWTKQTYDQMQAHSDVATMVQVRVGKLLQEVEQAIQDELNFAPNDSVDIRLLRGIKGTLEEAYREAENLQGVVYDKVRSM